MTDERVPFARLKLLAPVMVGSDGKIVVSGPRDQMYLNDPEGIVGPFLSRFDGFTDTSEIVSQAASDADAADLTDLAEYLRRRGVLVPSHHQFQIGHLAGSNPQTFASGVQLSEIAQLQIAKNVTTFNNLIGLARLASARVSCRSFDEQQTIEVSMLRALLRLAQSSSLRPTALAGAIQSVKLVVLRRDEHSLWNILRWDPRAEDFHDETSQHSLDNRQIKFALDNEDALFGAAAAVVLLADVEVHAKKYSNRGYRYALIEVGQVAQMLALAAAEENLACLEYGGFRDEALADLLSLGRQELPLLVVGVGRPDEGVEPLSLQVSDALYRLTRWQEDNADRFRYVGRKEPTAKGTSLGVAIAQCQFGGEASSGNSRFATGVAISTSRATVRAVAEAIERAISGEIRIDAEGPEAGLPAEAMVPSISTLTYEDARAFTDSSTFQPYEPKRTYRWVRGYRRDGACPFLPIELVYYPIPREVRVGPLCGAASSSGVAVAATTELAESAALAELIERDAFVRSWIAKSAPGRWLNLPSWAIRLVRDWDQRGVKMGVHVFKSAGLATVGVSLIQNSFPRLCWGMASSPWAEASLEKAYEEVCGSFVGASEELAAVRAEDIRGPLDHANYYWSGDTIDAIEWYFSGQESTPSIPDKEELRRLSETASYFDLGGPERGYPLRAIRAVHEQLRPIWFGSPLAPSQFSIPPHFFP